MSTSLKPTLNISSKTADGSLIGLLTVGFYILFTLLPSSHSLMVSWPWVAVWQVALLMPIVWLLWQLWFKPLSQFKLGSGLDWSMMFLVIGLGISTFFSEFPNQALWYSLAALGGIAALYSLSGWLHTPKQAMQLLRCQALLSIAFILLSLGLWVFQTYFPELERLAQLEQYGISQQFDFGVTSLRNWYPLGHQNYVAGYLVLILPLLFSLGITDKGWLRWMWASGCCLGLVDLYTASSRGGLIALVLTVAIALAITLIRSQLPRRLVLPAGGLMLCILVAATLGNSRVRRPLIALLQGKTSNSEIGYRIITNTIGWRIGVDHPFTGAGPGSVIQLYQKYRPYWAGREAELHFQLHSTPAQLWAELGIWGVAASVSLAGLLSWLTWRWSNRNAADFLSPSLVWGLTAGLFAYGLMALTDYQLDTLPISGVLVVYLAILSRVYAPCQGKPALSQKSRKASKVAAGLLLGSLVAAAFWLAPVHRAWAISKQGFDQLRLDNINGFEQSLTQAHQLAAWEPYYPSMLAWVLGDLHFQSTGDTQDLLRTTAIDWFKSANVAAPHQEFGQSNLGWLLMPVDAQSAQDAFMQAAQLVPAKQGVFLGLGYSLLRLGKTDLAIQALTLEILRHPLAISSGIWRFPQFAPLQEPVLQQAIDQCSSFLTNASPRFNAYLHLLRGSLYWWQGNLAAAETDWEEAGIAIGPAVIALSQEQPLPESFSILVATPAKLVIQAWQKPQEREALLVQALADASTSQAGLETNQIQFEQLFTSMNEAKTFDSWLKQRAPIVEPRHERTGFGVLSRHIDGILPKDYLPILDNLPVKRFFSGLFPSSTYFPELDEALQPTRDNLLAELSS